MGIVHNENFISIAPFYAISFLGLYFYFAVASLVDIPGKIKILHINLVDYLENHLASRLEQAELDMQLIQPESKTKNRAKRIDPDTAIDSAANTDPQESFVLSKDEAEELEHLLKEFLL